MGQNGNKESGQEDEENDFPTVVRILEGLEVIQVASGHHIILFPTSERDALEIGNHNKSGEPFLKHEFPEPIFKIVTGYHSLYALSSPGNVFSWRENGWNQLGFPGREENVLYKSTR